MAVALSSYARALTFENRSRRNLYRLAGLAPRLRDKIFEKLIVFSFFFCFALPLAASSIYYVFIASPQYSTEVRFVVRSSAPLLSRDRYASANAEPKAKIVQDTSVILNYLESPGMVRDLQNIVSLNQMFGRSDIDFLSRLDADATQEELTDYWNTKFTTEVNPKSGIVTLNVYGFSPQESFELLAVVLQLAEQRVNKLNSGIWTNLFASAQSDVEAASNDLEDLRAKFRDAQNETGVYDIELAAESLHQILTKIEADIATLKSEREALSVVVGEDTPRLADLDRQIAARVIQSQVLKDRIAGGETGGGKNLAETFRVFEDLQLNVKMAEDRLASAIEELEKVRLVSALQLVYLDQFTDPIMPDTSSYPDKPLALFLSLLICLTMWGATAGSIALLRNKLD